MTEMELLCHSDSSPNPELVLIASVFERTFGPRATTLYEVIHGKLQRALSKDAGFESTFDTWLKTVRTYSNHAAVRLDSLSE